MEGRAGGRLQHWARNGWVLLKRWVEGKHVLKASRAVEKKGRQKVANVLYAAVAIILVLALFKLPSDWVPGLAAWLVGGAIREMLAVLGVATVFTHLPHLRKIEIAVPLFLAFSILLWLVTH